MSSFHKISNMVVKRDLDSYQSCDTEAGGAQRRVSFSDAPDEVMELVDRYPTNFFYDVCDVIK